MSYELPGMTEAWRAVMEQFGNLSIMEAMNTGTSTISMAQLVSTRAAFQMLTKVDARNFCRLENVPPGGGMTYHIQFIPVKAAGSVTETVGLASSTDYNPQDITITLGIYGIRTDFTDLLQRQAAINFADAVGRAHGNGILQQINNALYTTVLGNSTNKRTISGSGEQIIAWNDVVSAMRLVESARGEPDTFISSPKKVHELMMQDVGSNLFTSAYADYIRSGKVGVVAGMSVFSDPVFHGGESWAGTSGEEYAAILQSDEAVAWGQAWDVSTEIQRVAEAIGFKMVSSIAGGSARVVEPFIATIEHV